MSFIKATVGQKVSFLLDGRWEGKGVVTEVKNEYTVILTKPCKEFAEGSHISISDDEIYMLGA